MGRILSDLSYNKKTLKPIGRPVDDLKALYKEKKDDYNYVIDSLNATETALNQVPFHERDKGIVDVAKNRFKDTFNTFEEEGDFENKIIDTKRLANDLTNKYGLLDVQRVAQEKDAYLNTMKERLDKGDITRQQYQNAVIDSERNYKGLQKDPTTGQFIGNYNGTQVQNFVNASKEIADVLKGFKANKIILTNEAGQQIVRDPSGSGYFIAGTKESVSEAELVRAAKAHIESSPEIQSQFQEDTYFELQNLLHDRNGNKRQLTTNDIRNLVLSQGTSKEVMARYGVETMEDLDDLENVLKGRDLEQVYSTIKQDQLTNKAMRLGVEKESYDKYEANYLRDWLLDARIKSSGANTISGQYEMLHTYDNPINLTSQDIERSVKVLEEGKENLGRLNAKLKSLRGSEDAQEKANTIKEIEEQKLLISDIEEQQALVFENVDMDEMFSRYENLDEAVGDVIIDIPKAELKPLIYGEMNGTLTDEEIKNSLKDIMTEDEYIAEENKDTDKNLEVEFSSNYNDYVDKKIKQGRARIRHATNYFKDQIDKSDKEYVSQYKTLMFSEMKAEDRRNHPMASTWDTIENLPKIDAGFYRNMSAVGTNVSLKTQIEEDLDLGKNSEEDGTIKWDTAKVNPTLDYRPDRKNGRYRPTVLVTVDVETGRRKGKPVIQKVTMPVFYDNENYEKRFRENLEKYRDTYVEKSKQRNLTPAENELLDRANLNLYNTTPYSRRIDLKNLHSMPNGSDTRIQVNENLSMNVRAYKNDSPSGQNFYITEGTGDNAEFLGFDNNGEVVRLSEIEMRSPEIADRIRKGELSMLGGNTVTALKTQFADMTLSARDAERFRVDLANTEDITQIFKSDVKEGVNPRIHKENVASVKALKFKYPGLIVTDAIRPTDVAYGDEGSFHKYAKALDFRLNNDSKKLLQEPQSTLDDLGIRSIGLHGDHVHVVFK